MGTSATQAVAFYEEGLRAGSVWTIRDAGGYPAPPDASGKCAQPFWSLRSRAERVVQRVPVYAGFEVVEITLEVFRYRWLRGLRSDGLGVGLNWSGPHAMGYDVSPGDVERRLVHIQNLDPKD